MPSKLLQLDETVPIAATECQALVERVGASLELRRAARLRAFLLYVCEQTLRRGATVIHEQEIGAAVFGRPESYDTGIDNIVRVNATELRKRLEHFFANEGRSETLILEIQRGSYIPTFYRRPAELPELAPDPQAPKPQAQEPQASETSSATLSPPAWDAAPRLDESLPVERASAHPTSGWLRLWRAAALLLLVGCVALAWQVHSLSMKMEPWTREPATRAFWAEFFESGNDTDILLADTSFGLAEDMMQRNIPLPDYLNYNYKRLADDPALPEIQRNDLARVLERNNGSIADFRVGLQILALNMDRRRFTLEFARAYSPEAAKHHSLILIGSRQSNPWVSLFADKMNFDLEYDSVSRRAYVVNRAPEPGEAAQYPSAGGADAPGTGYAVIAFMPNLSGRGRTLILEGSDSQATGAAGDFITSEDALGQLEKKFPARTIPYFEVLLRTSQLSGTPLHGEIIAYRVYPAGKSK